jgi:SAM-dependent methyltransferase
MKHGLLDPEVRGQFAGHETFPLRLLWLKKAFDAVKGGAPSGTFQEQSAIARFGVGRNMAVSMRYWALASGFVEEVGRVLRPTALGAAILADDGLDPFIERPATTWLVHWAVASAPRFTTTAYDVFNGLAAIEFDAAMLVDELFSLAEVRGWRVTRGTLKRDVEVFLRSYVRREGGQVEDAAEPLLAELGLIREARFGGWHEFVRGPKPTLPDGVFAFALAEFWGRQGGSTALAVEQICYAAGSPGRVFKLDEDSVVTRLMALEAVTKGAWRWTDTAGLRQIQRVGDVNSISLVQAAYPSALAVVA